MELLQASLLMVNSHILGLENLGEYSTTLKDGTAKVLKSDGETSMLRMDGNLKLLNLMAIKTIKSPKISSSILTTNLPVDTLVKLKTSLENSLSIN